MRELLKKIPGLLFLYRLLRNSRNVRSFDVEALRQPLTKASEVESRRTPTIKERKLRISVINFWPTAFKNDFLNFFMNQVTDGNHDYVPNKERPDITISSVFGTVSSPAHKTIFYTGENVRPNFLESRFSLSFDQDDWGGRNFYLPFWYTRIAWPGYEYKQERDDGRNVHGYEDLIRIEDLVNERHPANELFDKRFCALIASKRENSRINLYRYISSYKPIDGFGPMFSNPIFRSKFSILSKYKFCLCPENSFYPGYVTEKVFDAWAGGTVPIYFGSTPSDGVINQQAFLNYGNSFDIDAFLEEIAELDSNVDKYNDIYRQPLLKKAPTLDAAIAFTRGAIDAILGGR